MRAMTSLLAIVWTCLVLGGASAHRPPPRRALALAGPNRQGRSNHRSGRCPGWKVRDVSALVGSWVLKRLGRPSTPLLARRTGAAVLTAAAITPFSPVAATAAAGAAWALPAMRDSRSEKRRLATLAADLPDTVDLLALAVSSGHNVRLAVQAVGERASGPLGAELARAAAEASKGRRLADALDDIPGRSGEAVRPLISALVASDRYGAPLTPTLERLAGEVRANRRRRAEEAARRVPVKLLFPLVSCTLPAFALLTVAPLIASAIRSLRP